MGCDSRRGRSASMVSSYCSFSRRKASSSPNSTASSLKIGRHQMWASRDLDSQVIECLRGCENSNFVNTNFGLTPGNTPPTSMPGNCALSFLE
jgi:hypothetical protein